MSNNNELITEIEEAVQQEKLEKLWKEYGSYLIATIILTVLVTALFTGWRGWNSKINTGQTAAVLQALDSGDRAAAALMQVAPGLRPNHRAIAQLTAAGLLLDEGRREEALAQYRAIAAANGADPVLGDLGTLLAVRLEWAMAGGTEETDAAALVESLRPLWSNEKSPWRWHAHEQAALILAHGLEDYATARGHLQKITGAQEIKNAAPSLQERARALDHVYGQKISALEADGRKQNPKKEEPEG